MDFSAVLSKEIEDIPHSESLEEFLSEYKCLQLLGEGGFGKVRKAVQLSDQRRVAIKFIANKKITSWHYYAKHKKLIPMEIASMCRCRSVKGVIKIIKYFEIKEQKGWYIVMEGFEKCIDLFDYITNQGHLSEKLASDFMRQLISIVINCHRLGICHRDIKDENIVIDLQTMTINLIDFGASSILHDQVYTEFDGTRVYSPPEWINFKQYYALPLEVWTIGVLLYDMVCGNLPFDSDDGIINGIFHFRRSISSHCQDLIQSCLQHDYTKRIHIKDILKHPWFKQQTDSNRKHSQRGHSAQFRVPDVDITYNFQTNCCSSYDSDSGQKSLESSPFSSPQSSGLEDPDNSRYHTSDPVTSCHLQSIRNDHPKKHNNSNIDHIYSTINFRKL